MKILVIDDDAAVRYTMARILRAAGHEVTIASDGEHGLETLHADPPDLTITDLIMPRQDGIQTIREIRRWHPAVKIIAISGGSRTMNVDGLAAALEAGADGIIIKPFDPSDLIDRVAEIAAPVAAQRP
jgi:DNA-binding response OmpR family regulator